MKDDLKQVTGVRISRKPDGMVFVDIQRGTAGGFKSEYMTADLAKAMTKAGELIGVESEQVKTCPRCAKRVGGIHTCSPTVGWIELEKQRDELLAENKMLKATQYGSGRLQELRDQRDELLTALEHLEHNARKSGANMGLALDVARTAIASVKGGAA